LQYLASKLKTVDSLYSRIRLWLSLSQTSTRTLPSSAAVEGLFSAASQVLIFRRCRMLILVSFRSVIMCN